MALRGRWVVRSAALLAAFAFAVAASAQNPANPAPAPPAPAAQDQGWGEPTDSLRSLPKNLLMDQRALWTSPFRMRTDNLDVIVPLAGISAFLIATDTAAETHLPTTPTTISHAATLSNVGMAGLLGAGGGLFVLGQLHNDSHERETGLLAGEAALDTYAASTAFKYIFGRVRPFNGTQSGNWFSGGDSFPSQTTSISWAVASVIAHEYPGPATQVLAYGTAGMVGAMRVIGHKHFISDTVIGSALGWYVGRQIYRARTSNPEIDGYNWGTFVKDPSDGTHDPKYMGSVFMPLDSWVYSAFDRLAALGYLPTSITGIKPWARLECARLLLEAKQESGYPESSSAGVTSVIDALQAEFALELGYLEGSKNMGAQLESVYGRLTEIGGRPIRDSYHFAQTITDDYGRPYGQGANAIAGFSSRAEAGPVAFYVRGEYQYASSITNYTPSASQAIAAADTLPIASVQRFPTASQFRPIEAYMALNIDNWEISFGQQSMWWGQEQGSSLMLSNNAQSMTMLRLGRIVPFQLGGPLAFLGQIRNSFFMGTTEGYNYLRGPFPQFPLLGNAFQSINPQPYVWGDRLSLKFSPNFEIGVSLTTMWAGQGIPATLKNFVHGFSTHGNQQTIDPGDRRTGFSFTYRLPGIRNWVQIYADGMAEDEPNPLAYPTKSAMNPGIYVSHFPKLPKLDLRVEAVYTNIPAIPITGYYYYNLHYADGYRTNDTIIGSWIGRQGDAIQAWSTYWFSAQNKIQFGYRRQWNDPAFLGGGGLQDASGSIDWLVKRQFQVSAGLQYERWNFPLIAPTTQVNVAATFQVTYWPSHGKAPKH